MWVRSVMYHVLAVAAIVAECDSSLAADERKIDLAAEKAVEDWKFLQPSARIEKGELVLDGRKEMSKAFYLPLEWKDVTLRAKFLVEPDTTGVLACGFVVRAVDAKTHYAVHYDRGQAILIRTDAGNDWIEIKRQSGLTKPAGEWHDAELQAVGDAIRVSLNGKLLYEARDAHLTQGRIGFYANQGVARVKDIVVVGKADKVEKPLVVPPPHFRIVCNDAGHGAYEAFPDVCRLKDGRLMCVFYAGYSHVSLPNTAWPKGGAISFCTSSDEGRTWSDAQTLYDGPDDDRDPSVVQLADGTILCNFFSLAKSSDPKQPYDGQGTWIVSSADNGKTWTEPRNVYPDYYCSTPVRILKSGRLILPLYNEVKGKSWGAVGFSDDQGKTWSKAVDIDNGGYKLDAETDVIELSDGTLYAAQRDKMCYAESRDRGETWSVSKPMPFAGQCPYFLRTPDNIILLAHRLPNTSLHYSLDECRTWSDNVVIDTLIGAYPSMVNLKDGSVRVVYYEEGTGSNIRARAFKATRTGIEWLEP